ncbi:MAG: CARDB domain-containing protein [Gammaproteobacteria bacterium]
MNVARPVGLGAIAAMPIVALAQTMPGPGNAIPARVAAELGPVTPLVAKMGIGPAPSQADLVIGFLGFSSDGRVMYQVQNRGQSSTENPFVVDIFIDGERRDTVKHPPLPPFSSQQVKSLLARPDVCAASVLHAAADPQQIVAEHSESNNALERRTAPPCPDLVVKITKDVVNNGLEYRAKVTYTNVGNLAAGGQFQVMLGGQPSGGAIASKTERRVGPLAAGASGHFYENGKHYGITSTSYHAVIDRLGEIPEQNEGNNQDHASF